MIELAIDNGKEPEPSNVIHLGAINLHDIAGTLHTLADDIEAGKLGQLERAIIVLIDEDGEPITIGCGESCNRIMTLGILDFAARRFYDTLAEYDEE